MLVLCPRTSTFCVIQTTISKCMASLEQPSVESLNFKPLHAFTLEAGWESFLEGVKFSTEDRFKMCYSMTV